MTLKLLAFDTSTQRMSVALQDGARQWQREDEGGPKASARLIATVLELLDEAGLQLRQLHAIAFGRGPGSFTGLRTACSVAQGLAFGASLPVLPVNTLLTVAEACRQAQGSTRVLALLDARMDQIYATAWAWSPETGWQAHSETTVCAPEDLALPDGSATRDWVLAGNAFTPYGARLPAALADLPRHELLPTASALLSLAPGLLATGQAVPAEQALPLYIRDKVAQTTAEREAARASQ